MKPAIPNLVMDEHHPDGPVQETTGYLPYRQRAWAAEAKIAELMEERARLRGSLQSIRDVPNSSSHEWTLARVRDLAARALK